MKQTEGEYYNETFKAKDKDGLYNDHNFTYNGVVEELQKVINAIGEYKLSPDDIAIVAYMNGELTSIKHKDLCNYVLKNGELTKKDELYDDWDVTLNDGIED
jgi:hypothetical protein